MNNVFTAKLLNNLRNKKANKGFTLIELLVVVIIIGVLAAVALPNLLAQVGKARETEGKNAMGTINRGEQAYHFEATEFTNAIIDNAALGTVTNPLGVAIASQYFNLEVAAGNATDVSTTADPAAAPNGKTAEENGTRGYAGAVNFDNASGLYANVLCQSKNIAAIPSPTADAATPANTGCGTDTMLK
jgi:prepilin-type N-terminal cleavage/methylation domain-containing protein